MTRLGILGVALLTLFASPAMAQDYESSREALEALRSGDRAPAALESSNYNR